MRMRGFVYERKLKDIASKSERTRKHTYKSRDIRNDLSFYHSHLRLHTRTHTLTHTFVQVCVHTFLLVPAMYATDAHASGLAWVSETFRTRWNTQRNRQPVENNQLWRTALE